MDVGGHCGRGGLLLATVYHVWLLVRLHKAVPGRRYNRYVQLAQAAFGPAKMLSPDRENSELDLQ